MNIPFVEKYRPTNFENIVLDPLNKIIFENIIKSSYFPNLLFYGPPGTGKTTTIINLVNAYQEKHNQKYKELIIHMNASDDRGIDIIRCQIIQFVNSNTLFNKGMKFIILDEVDYMTTHAQQALRYILQSYSENVRFCLICNYISRIDECLKQDFLCLRFNQLPEADIYNFLNNIIQKEKILISQDTLHDIQQLYKSDIRSMINVIQSSQNINNNYIHIIINKQTWEDLYHLIKNINRQQQTQTLTQFQLQQIQLEKIYSKIEDISIQYNMDKKHIIKDFLNYIIKFHTEIISHTLLSNIEKIIHIDNCIHKYDIEYILLQLINIFM